MKFQFTITVSGMSDAGRVDIVIHLEPEIEESLRSNAELRGVSEAIPQHSDYSSSKYPGLPTFIARVAPIWTTAPSPS